MKNKNGFTLIELLMVIAIIGILSSIVLVNLSGAQDRAKMANAEITMEGIAKVAQMYYLDHGQYPSDVLPGVMPSGLESYFPSGAWPTPPWPGSQYDWENWTDPATGLPIYQVSLRFCWSDGQCYYPNIPWVKNFDTNIYSAVYYCISGSCRSLSTLPDAPGYCLNC